MTTILVNSKKKSTLILLLLFFFFFFTIWWNYKSERFKINIHAYVSILLIVFSWEKDSEAPLLLVFGLAVTQHTKNNEYWIADISGVEAWRHNNLKFYADTTH